MWKFGFLEVSKIKSGKNEVKFRKRNRKLKEQTSSFLDDPSDSVLQCANFLLIGNKYMNVYIVWL